MKWQLIILIILIFPSINGLVLEQKIDIMNGKLQTTSTSWTPTTGSTGIVPINLTAYDNISEIYYEITGDYDFLGIPNGIGCGYAGLYDMTNGVQIDNATITLGGGVGIAFSVNLSYLWSNDNILVTPNGKACTNSQVNLFGARVVIVQEGEINKTRTFIPIGMSSGTTGTCVGGGPDPENIYPKKWIWNDTDFGGSYTLRHGGTIYRVGGALGTRAAYANIANTTNDVPGGQISTTNTAPTWVIATPSVALVDEGQYYGTLCRSLSATNALEANAFIIIDQTGIYEDLNLTLVYQMENTQRIVTGFPYQYSSEQRMYYNGSKIQGYNIEKYTHDATFKTQAFSGTEYALVQPRIGTTILGTASLSTTSTSAVELRADFDFSANASDENSLNEGVMNLDAATNTVIWSGRLLIKINGLEQDCWTYDAANHLLYIPNGCLYYIEADDFV